MPVPKRRSDAAVHAERVRGRYRLGALLGRGGHGEVFVATDEVANREVALKRLRLVDAPEPEVYAIQFRREFHKLATLKHPRIIEAYDFGVEDWGLFYTMELLRGLPLRALAPVEPALACRLLRDVASALAFLHARQLIHRDISPRNAIALEGDVAKLIDFGSVSTPGVQREIVGTVGCLAPEAVLSSCSSTTSSAPTKPRSRCWRCSRPRPRSASASSSPTGPTSPQPRPPRSARCSTRASASSVVPSIDPRSRSSSRLPSARPRTSVDLRTPFIARARAAHCSRCSSFVTWSSAGSSATSRVRGYFRRSSVPTTCRADSSRRWASSTSAQSGQAPEDPAAPEKGTSQPT